MQLATIRKVLWPFGVRMPDQAVLQDADDLVRTWGDGAYMVASTMAWREEAGLVFAAEAKHWARVRQEIGHRQGWQDGEPEADFEANVNRLWLDA